MTALLAILDIGKTHAKVVLVEAGTGQEVFTAKRANISTDTPLCRQLDVVAIERWLCEALRSTPLSSQVAAIVPVAHGATAVLIAADGSIVAAPDYEDRRFEDVSDAYEALRESFATTLSPSLPLGLNLGRQLFYLQSREPQAFGRVAKILLYPQYWAWRLSGVAASELTSLGCHTDLWRPRERNFSALARSHGWHRLLPAIQPASAVLGAVTAGFSLASGLPADCRVICGIHDSNASYLDHLLSRGREQPFAVISSGTWTVVMANRGDPGKLREARDMLANIDAFGEPVATARFMGGREYEAIAPDRAPVDVDALATVLQRNAIALPSFAHAGPFQNQRGRLLNADGMTGSERAALATLYVALMSDYTLDALGADGDVLIDGPLASNPLFPSVLAALRPARVFAVSGTSGVCVRAANYLAGLNGPPVDSLSPIAPLDLPALASYRAAWRAQLPPAAG